MKVINKLFILICLLFIVVYFSFNYYFVSKKLVYFWNGENNNFIEKDNGFVFFVNKKRQKKTKKEKTDINKDGKEESYILKNGKLTIFEESKKLWESPNEWKITNFVLADSTNDGILDLNISLWKPGNFGPSKPFWIEENDMNIKNHFFIFDIVNGSLKQVWGSSNLSNPNCEFDIADVDGDSQNDLIVIEGNYADGEECKGKNIAVWNWNGWGFSNEWRSKDGIFLNLDIVNNQINMITL